MRSPFVFSLTLLAACANHPDAPFTAPQLPTDALNVASFALSAAGGDFMAQSFDPSLVADLNAYEDDGCWQDSTNPAVLNANVTAYVQTRTYGNCANGIGSATTGTRTVTVNDANSTQVFLQSAYNLNLQQNDGSTMALTSNTNVVLNGSAAMGSVERAYATTGAWNDPGNESGTVQNVNNTFTLTDTFDPNSQLPTSTVFDGVFNESYPNASQGFQATYTKVVLTPSQCCFPVGGTISETQFYNDGSSQTATWVFSSTCGQVTLNGSPLNITNCL